MYSPFPALPRLLEKSLKGSKLTSVTNCSKLEIPLETSENALILEVRVHLAFSYPESALVLMQEEHVKLLPPSLGC